MISTSAVSLGRTRRDSPPFFLQTDLSAQFIQLQPFTFGRDVQIIASSINDTSSITLNGDRGKNRGNREPYEPTAPKYSLSSQLERGQCALLVTR